MDMDSDQIETSAEAAHQTAEDGNSTSIGPGEVYTCTFCLTTFPKQTMLINHVIRLHPFEEIPARLPLNHSPPPVNGALFCRFCEFYTMMPQHMLSHLKLHTGEYPFRCSFCPMKAMNVIDIKQHALATHGKDTFEVEISQPNNLNQFMGYKCSSCDYVQIMRSNTEEHIKKKHPDTIEKPIQVSLIRTSIAHWLTGTVNKPETVSESLDKDGKLQELPQNTGTLENENKSLEIVSISDDDESAQKALSKGIVSIEKSTKKEYLCCFNPCHFKTSAPQYLKVHFRSLHQGCVPFTCNNCHFQTDHMEEFLQHLIKSNNGSCESDKQISIDQLYSVARLVENQKSNCQTLVAKNYKFEELFPPSYTVENLRNLFKCMQEGCSFTTDNEVAFIKHVSSLHPPETFRYFICCYCKVELINNISLICNHMKKEHGNCLHQCAFCFYRAVNRWYVYLHQQHRHPSMDTNIIKCDKLDIVPLEIPGEIKLGSIMIPYRCAIGDCNFEEIDPNIFKQHHQSNHNGVTIIPCHHCKSEFLMISSLISHYKIHGCNNFQCPHCLYGSETHEEMEFHLWNKHPNKAGQVFVRGSMDNVKRPNLVTLSNKVPLGNRCKVTLFEIQAPSVTKPIAQSVNHFYNINQTQSSQPSPNNNINVSNVNTSHMHNSSQLSQPHPPPHVVSRNINRYPVQIQPLPGTPLPPPNSLPVRPQSHFSNNSIMNIQHQIMVNPNQNLQNIPRILNVGSLSPVYKNNVANMGNAVPHQIVGTNYNNINQMMNQPQICQPIGMIPGPYNMHGQTIPPPFRLPPPPQLHPAPSASPSSVSESKKFKHHSRPVTVQEMLQQKRHAIIQQIPPPPPLHPRRPHIMEISESHNINSSLSIIENKFSQTLGTGIKMEKGNSSCCQQLSEQKFESRNKNDDVPLEWILDQIQALSGTKKGNEQNVLYSQHIEDIGCHKLNVNSFVSQNPINKDFTHTKKIEEKMKSKTIRKMLDQLNSEEEQNLISDITVESFNPKETDEVNNQLFKNDGNFESNKNRKNIEHKAMSDNNLITNSFAIKIKEEPPSPEEDNEIDVGYDEFSDLDELNLADKVYDIDASKKAVNVKAEKNGFDLNENFCNFSEKKSSFQNNTTAVGIQDKLPVYINKSFYKCGIVNCSFETEEFSHFLSHNVQVHPNSNNEFMCKHCNINFINWEKFCGHLRLHGPNLFKCSSCFYISWQKSEIFKHCQLKHSSDKAYSITVRCGSKEINKSLKSDKPACFTDSQVSNSDYPCYVSGNYECGIDNCDFNTENIDAFQNHLIGLHRHLYQIPCKYCQSLSYTVDKFLEHLQLHGPELYQCGLCDFMYSSKSNVEQHCAEIHRTHRIQIVTIREAKINSDFNIGKSAHVKNTLSSHKLYHCEFCDFSSENREIMFDHIKQHNAIRSDQNSKSPKPKSTSLPVACRSPSFNSLVNRISSPVASDTNGNFPFKKGHMWQCSRCTYTAKIRNDVINHFLRHINVKPLRCNHCGKCFYTIGDVSKHSQIVHTDIQKSYTRIISKDKIERLVGTADTFEPVGNNKMRITTGRRICPLCGYKTNKMPHLRRHLSSHLQYKPLKCFYCETRFFELTVLKSHHYQKHTNEPLKYYKSNNKIEEAKYETLLKSVGIELSPTKDNIDLKDDFENIEDNDESESETELDLEENINETLPVTIPKPPLFLEPNAVSSNLNMHLSKQEFKEKSGSSSENEAPDTMLFCNVELSVDDDSDKGNENNKLEWHPSQIDSDTQSKSPDQSVSKIHEQNPNISSNFMGPLDPREAQIEEIKQASATLFKSMFSAPVKCLSCGYQTIHGGSLVYHMRIHTSSISEDFQIESDDYPQFVPYVNPLVCDINNCIFEAENYLDFKHHINGAHKNDTYPCGLCKAQFTVIEKMVQHRRLHGPNLFKCGICGYIYWRRHGMLLHYTSKHPRLKPQIITVRQFLEEKPKKGDEILDSSSELFSHIPPSENSYIPGIPEYAACTFSCGNWDCDFVGDTACTLSNHYLTIHTGLKQFDCKHCNAKFTQVKKFCQHLQLHGPSLFMCSLCNHMHWRRKRVIQHGLEAHNTRFNTSNIITIRHNTKIHIDDMSDDMSPSPEEINLINNMPSQQFIDSMDHINVQAVNKQRIRCSMCPFVGATCTGFLGHLKVHGSYDYLMCGYCSLRTRNKSFMINHLSKSHSNQGFKVRPLFKQESPNRLGGKRQWTCKRCAYHADSFLDLMSHIKLNHATNKRYRCEACHKLFSNYGHCYRHWKTSHRDNGLPWKYEIVFVKHDTDFRYKHLNLNPLKSLQVQENMDNSYDNKYQEHNRDGIRVDNQQIQQINPIQQQLQQVNDIQQQMKAHQKQFMLVNGGVQSDPDINIVKWVTRKKPRDVGASCCPYCNYRTDTRQHLRRHIGIHLGYKPYKCDYCSYTGIESYTIAKHIKMSHGDLPVKFSRCHNPKRVAQINKLVRDSWQEGQIPSTNQANENEFDDTNFDDLSNSGMFESQDQIYENDFTDSALKIDQVESNWSDENTDIYKQPGFEDSFLEDYQNDSSDLNKDSKKNVKKRPFIYKCKYCIYWSVEKPNALRHIKNVHQGKPLAVLKVENKNPDERPIPFKYSTKKRKGFMCLHCKKLSVSKNGIYKHWLLFHREKAFEYKYFPGGKVVPRRKYRRKNENISPADDESFNLLSSKPKAKPGPLSTKRKSFSSSDSSPNLNSKTLNSWNQNVRQKTIVGPLSVKMRLDPSFKPYGASPSRSETPPPPRLNRQDEIFSIYDDDTTDDSTEMPVLPTEEFSYYRKKSTSLDLSKITTMMSLGLGGPVKISAKALDSILNLHPIIKLPDLKFEFLKR